MPPILAYYGDDFTGSTDVMEVLQWSGLRTILFMNVPTQDQLNRFEGLVAFGIAGDSRSKSVAEMEDILPGVFQFLRDSGARIIHYKTCSTFDSSPEIGSIGKAIELGRRIFSEGPIPVVVGAPNLGRYQAFGNLFARSGLGSEPYRLDRHPTMSQHPITPMHEADLRRVLQAQGITRVDLVDLIQLEANSPSELLDDVESSESEVVLFDLLTSEHLVAIGELLDALSRKSAQAKKSVGQFVVGSSGVEAAWTTAKRIAEKTVEVRPTFSGVDRLLVLTGSCSPVNARQIAWAEENGFASIAISPSRLLEEPTALAEIERIVEEAIVAIDAGQNIILHTSRGPKDSRIGETLQKMQRLGLGELEIKLQSGKRLGPKLGALLEKILVERSISRIGIAGGDTSAYIVRQLGIEALEAIAYVTPGAPLCLAHSANRHDGLELILKGGQVGNDSIWETVLRGTS